MKTPTKILLQSFSLIAVLAGLGVAPLAHAEEEGLTSTGSSDVSGTAGVRGGDVMGKALLRARPNNVAVDRMEARRVSDASLKQFQQQGKVGRFAQ